MHSIENCNRINTWDILPIIMADTPVDIIDKLNEELEHV